MKIKNLLLTIFTALLLSVLVATVYCRVVAPCGESAFVNASTSFKESDRIPSPTPTQIPKATSSPMPSPEPYADKPDIDISSWEYRLVNAQSVLEEDFEPELTSIENGHLLDSRAVEALKQFVAAALEEGLSVYIISSYRSYSTQKYLFDRKVNQYICSEGSHEAAVEKAKTIVAYPGSSEHQLGLAVDIVDKYYEYMNESLENTELSVWMRENCAEYGFILRYGKDKNEITGVMFEPWHYRYVGKEAATYIMENDLTLEQFVALYEKVPSEALQN